MHKLFAATFAASMCISSVAFAQTVTVNPSGANFSNAVGAGAGTAEYFDTDGLVGNEEVTFGNPATPTTPPNSLLFTSAGSQSVSVGSQFALGSLQFNNFPNFDNVDSFALTITASLNYLGNALTPAPFAFQLAINNTPNAEPCQFPGGPVCADALTIIGSPTPTTFTIGGQTLTLFIDGFRDGNGVFNSIYIAEELGSTTATLVGRFDLVGPVPEPGTWALMIAGFGIAGGALRRRRAVLQRAIA